VALAAAATRDGACVLGVHATAARAADADADADDDGDDWAEVPATTAAALARAAAAAHVPHTLALAPRRARAGGAAPAAAVAAASAAAALSLASVAMGTGATRLAGCALELHRHKGLLMALADAGVTLEWSGISGGTPAPVITVAATALAALRAASVPVAWCATGSLRAEDQAAAAAAAGLHGDGYASALAAAARASLLASGAGRDALALRAPLTPADVAGAAAASAAANAAVEAAERARAAAPLAKPRAETEQRWELPLPSPSPPRAAPQPLPLLSPLRAQPPPAAARPSPLPSPRASPARRRARDAQAAAVAQHAEPPPASPQLPPQPRPPPPPSPSPSSAASEPDVELAPVGPGPFPLLWAVARRAPLDLLSLMLFSRPEDASSSDAEGRTPLHFAAATRAPHGVLAALLAAAPRAAARRDARGWTPLHAAAVAGVSGDALSALAAAHPPAATARDAAGRTPAALAAAHDAPLETLAFLRSMQAEMGGGDDIGIGSASHASSSPYRTPPPSPGGARLRDAAQQQWVPPVPASPSSPHASRAYATPSPNGGADGGGGDGGSSCDGDFAHRVAAARSPAPRLSGSSSVGGGGGSEARSPLPRSPLRPAPVPHIALSQPPSPLRSPQQPRHSASSSRHADAVREEEVVEDDGSVLTWLLTAAQEGLPEATAEDGGDAQEAGPSPAAIVAQLLEALSLAAHAADAVAADEQYGGGGGGGGGQQLTWLSASALARRGGAPLPGAPALLRRAAHAAARHACLAELLRRATRDDPLLPWHTAPPQHTGTSASASAPFPPSPSLWARISRPASPSARPSPPSPDGDAHGGSVLDAACAQCRAAMLSTSLLCGRYFVLPAAPDGHPHAPSAAQQQLRVSATSGSQLLFARDGAAGNADVALLFVKTRERFERERTARSAARRAAGAAAPAAALVHLLRAHEGVGSVGGGLGGACAGDGFGAPMSDTFSEELDARQLWPFLLVFERAAGSLADLLAAQAAEAPTWPPAAASGVSSLLAGVPRLRPCVPRTSWPAVRALGWRCALGLHVLHETGLAHGALCPSHVLLLPDAAAADAAPGTRWALCDLSASLSLRGNAAAVGGAEFMSPASAPAARYLPPEAVLLPSDDTEDADGHAYVNGHDPFADAPTAPPSLKLVPRGSADAWAPGALRGGIACDAWALGALLFEAVTARPLLPEGDAPRALRYLAAWDATALEDALRAVHAAAHPGDASEADAAAAAASLLRRLLSPAPEARVRSMRDVLASRFLNPSGATVPERCADILAACLCPSPSPVLRAAGGGTTPHPSSGVLVGVPRGGSSPASEASGAWLARSSDTSASPNSSFYTSGGGGGGTPPPYWGGSGAARAPSPAALPPLPPARGGAWASGGYGQAQQSQQSLYMQQR
jgi:hypothetical protein